MAAVKKKTAEAAIVEIAPEAIASEESVQEAPVKFKNFTVSCEGYAALNVRQAPSFGGKPVRTLKNGQKVKAAPAVDGWCELKDGGFVKAEFLG